MYIYIYVTSPRVMNTDPKYPIRMIPMQTCTARCLNMFHPGADLEFKKYNGIIS